MFIQEIYLILKKQLEKKTQAFMNRIVGQPAKIMNLFLHEKFTFVALSYSA